MMKIDDPVVLLLKQNVYNTVTTPIESDVSKRSQEIRLPIKILLSIAYNASINTISSNIQ